LGRDQLQKVERNAGEVIEDELEEEDGDVTDQQPLNPEREQTRRGAEGRVTKS
jgi:hypothetical protein